jgi:hypothetical protein
MLNIREQEVVKHLKEHRPKMYRELLRSGQLEATAARMWKEFVDQLYELTTVQKLPHNQAMEMCRELAFPPSERDQPRLGEDPGPLHPWRGSTAVTRTPAGKSTGK